jgi:hypothetical protein
MPKKVVFALNENFWTKEIISLLKERAALVKKKDFP